MMIVVKNTTTSVAVMTGEILSILFSSGDHMLFEGKRCVIDFRDFKEGTEAIIEKVTQRIINGHEFIVWYIDLFFNDDVATVKVEEGLYNCITDGSREWPIGELSVKIDGITDSIKRDFDDIATNMCTDNSRKNIDKKSRELVERVFEKIINAIDVITQ